MAGIYLFLVKSIIVSGILTTWYWFGLRDKKLHRYNRFFLLFILYASIQLPLLHFQLFTVAHVPTVKASPAAYMLTVIGDSEVPYDAGIANMPEYAMYIEEVLVLGSVVVSMVLLITLTVRIISILRLSRRYPGKKTDGVTFISTDHIRAPFSFLNYLFWRTDIPQDTDSGRLIMAHELTHIRQRHTYDKLACQLLTCIFWMNPFYWIIQKELEMVHEFIADENAIGEGDTDAFARMLLQTHNNGQYLVPEHQFFSSPIKRRLTMLQTTSKTKHALSRRMMVLPLVAGAITIFSFTAGRANPEPQGKVGAKIVLVVDAGHGGTDIGCHYGSLKEKDLNLRIAQRISELSNAYNIVVRLTRTRDETLTVEERVTICKNFRANDFISIHIGDMEGSTGKGTYDVAVNAKSPNAGKSAELAQAVYKHIAEPGWEQKGKVTDNSAYVLRKNSVPSVLIELGDIKNKEQMDLLTDNAKLDKVCRAILEGVIEANKG